MNIWTLNDYSRDSMDLIPETSNRLQMNAEILKVSSNYSLHNSSHLLFESFLCCLSAPEIT